MPDNDDLNHDLNHGLNHAELQALLDHARRLPKEIAPTPQSWSKIHDRIEGARVRELLPPAPTVDATPIRATTGVRRGWWDNPRVALPVAALLFLAVTTLALVLDLQNTPATPTNNAVVPAVAMVTRSTASTASPSPSDAPPSASMTAVFAQYDEATLDLTNDFEKRRARLQPEAVAVLDSCLITMNRAISESRTALVESPDNTVIADLLQQTYQQKLDLLRRAADLPLGIY